MGMGTGKKSYVVRMKTYWSIQKKKAWEHMQKTGFIESSPEFIDHEWMGDAYQWMMEQMKKRLPHYRGEVPIWLWPNRPDMRHSAHDAKGTEIVRLTIRLPEEKVLLSDFDGWHSVINNSFLSDTEFEFDYWKEIGLSKEESWERIFDLTRERDEEWRGKAEDMVLQGTTGRVPIDAVVKVENFIAK